MVEDNNIQGQMQLSAADAEAPERRLLTVMFVDLVGSTKLAESCDPEDLRELIRRYQIAVTAAVVRFEGYVAKFAGDGVMAYFGWPRAHEDEAERAVRAARDVVAAVRGLATPNAQPLQVRVGIATGEVVVGNIQGDITHDYQAAIGLTPNLADRLQRLAPVNGIAIGPTTQKLLGSVFEVESLGLQEVKGFQEPLEAWRVLRERETESRFDAQHSGALSRYVGRERENRALQDAWDKVKTGKGQVVVITGEAGIGKSRLIQEFRRTLGSAQRFGLHYQCSAHHQNSAFMPAIQQIKRAVGIADTEPASARREKVRTLFGLSARNLDETTGVISALLRIDGPEADQAMALPAAQLRQQTIDCLVDQALGLSARQPVLMTFEDAHWADPSTISYICQLIASIADRPVMLLITQRPEAGLDWGEGEKISALQLRRVARRQAEEIVHEVAGRAADQDLVDLIVARAEGVPLFVEELTKAVMESGSQEQSAVEKIPTTLRTSLVGRLDRLGDAKRIAQIGAVLGREFRHDVLVEISDLGAQECEHGLRQLISAGLVVGRGVPPEATYTFKHALIQDAAYGTILKKRRRDLHCRIVRLLEGRLQHGTNAPPLELVAFHAKHAEDWQRAYDYAKQAGADAISRSALPEGVAHFDEALTSARNLPKSPELLTDCLDLRFELRNALWALGRFEDILDHLDLAEQDANALSDDLRLGWIAVYRSASLWQLGRTEEALEAAERGAKAASGAGNLALGVASDFYFGCARVTTGDYKGAIRHFEDVINALPGDRAFDKCGLPFAPSIISRSWLIWALADRGVFDPALHHAIVAEEQAQALNLPFNKAHVAYDVGYLHILREDFDAAIETLAQGHALVERWGLTYLGPFMAGFLGYAYVRSGDLLRGIQLLEEANNRYDKINLGLFRALVRIQTAEAMARAGEVNSAKTHLDAGLSLARSRSEWGFVAHGTFVAGIVAGMEGDADATGQSASLFEEALAMAETLGMEPLAARCRSALDRLSLELRRRQGLERH